MSAGATPLENIPLDEVTRRIAVSTLRTLVVDDDPTSREMLSSILRRAGHVPIVASSGEEALELFRQHDPDMVLMDVMLPGMDGRDAMKRMKRIKGERWLPVILISVLDAPDEVLDGLRDGADDYLTKPVRIDHVLAKLRNTSRTLLLQTQCANALRFGRALMDHIHEAILCCDSQGLVQSVNRAAETLFCESADALKGRPLLDLVFDVDLQDVKREKYVDAGRYATGRRKGGALFAVEVRQTMVSIDCRMLTVLTLRDVSRQLSEERRVLNDAAQLREYKTAREAENALAGEMLNRLLHHKGCQPDALGHFTEAATGFSGDVVAALRSPKDRLFVVLADATGHGLAAAISLVPALSVLHAMVSRNCELSDIVAELNTKMLELMPVGRFLAAAVLCIDERERRGEIWVGGLPAVVMLDERGAITRRFESNQMALGIVPSDASTRAVTSFTWSTRCQVVLTSDGVLEAENVNGEPLGEERLHQALRRAEPSQRLEAARQALASHLAGLPASDDASVAIVDLH
jgi:PAS domain S-box-containing protein